MPLLLVLPCANQPPPALLGEGAERIYSVDVTNYRCPNGYKWETGIRVANIDMIKYEYPSQLWQMLPDKLLLFQVSGPIMD